MWNERALKVMQIIIERGEAALQLFTQGELDEGLEMLKARGAAFANFQVYDAKVPRSDQLYEQALRALAEKDKILCDKLLVLVAEARQEYHESLSSLRRAKDRLSQFKSHQNADPNWEKSV